MSTIDWFAQTVGSSNDRSPARDASIRFTGSAPFGEMLVASGVSFRFSGLLLARMILVAPWNLRGRHRRLMSMQTKTKPRFFPATVIGLTLGFVLIASVLAASPLNAKSTSPALKLEYSFADSSIPEARDLRVKIGGSKLTIEVLGAGKTIKRLEARIPPKLLAGTSAEVQKLVNVKLTGNICPGAETNTLEFTIGKKKVKRKSASCSGDDAAANKKNKEEFYKTEALMLPLFTLVGDRETAFGTR